MYTGVLAKTLMLRLEDLSVGDSGTILITGDSGTDECGGGEVDGESGQGDKVKDLEDGDLG